MLRIVPLLSSRRASMQAQLDKAETAVIDDQNRDKEPLRLPTGVPGLDTVLCGGLLPRGVYIVQGGPGEGKTILANQFCYSRAEQGERSLYVTLLAETHHRLLRHLRHMQFMAAQPSEDRVFYESAFDTLRNQGLEGVLRFLMRNAKNRKASIIVLDGLFALEETTESERTFREFINDVSAFADMSGSTVLLLTNSDRNGGSPEFTMVDGWIELGSEEEGSRSYRYLKVRKFRGSGFISGRHVAEISNQGFHVYPRLEAVSGHEPAVCMREVRVSTGVRRLDELIEGGVPYSSTTAILGPSGVGKTTTGLAFICQSTREEPGLIFGFYEDEGRLRRRSESLGLNLGELLDSGVVELIHYPPTEVLIDKLAEHLLEAVDRRGVQRLFLDGVDGFMQATVTPHRIARFFSALTAALRARGVTTMLTLAIAEIVGGKSAITASSISAVAENIILLRYAELESTLHRTIGIIKMRESGFSPHLHELYLGREGLVIGDRLRHTEGVVIGRAHRSLDTDGQDA